MRRTVHKLWPMVDLDAFRSEFPVLSHSIYLNSGTDGPVPTRAAEASAAAVADEVAVGRAGRPHFEKVLGNIDAMRGRIARLWNTADANIALTRSATDGVNLALNALTFEAGDDIVTTDEEHPGILAPLAALKARHGVNVRTVPWDDIAARGQAGDEADRRLARLLGQRPGDRHRGTEGDRACRSCSTARRAPARSRSTSTRSAATSTPPRARSGCAARTAPATCT